MEKGKRQIMELDEAAIKLDPRFQFRDGLDDKLVETYKRAMKENADLPNGGFPELEVMRVGDDYLLTDGFHRFRAGWLADIHSYQCIVSHGSYHDAWRAALRANKTNGKAVTKDADAKSYVVGALELIADLSEDEFNAAYGPESLIPGGERKRGERHGWSARDIARLTNLHHGTVSRVLDTVAQATVSEIVWDRQAKASKEQGETQRAKNEIKKALEPTEEPESPKDDERPVEEPAAEPIPTQPNEEEEQPQNEGVAETEPEPEARPKPKSRKVEEGPKPEVIFHDEMERATLAAEKIAKHIQALLKKGGGIEDSLKKSDRNRLTNRLDRTYNLLSDAYAVMHG